MKKGNFVSILAVICMLFSIMACSEPGFGNGNGTSGGNGAGNGGGNSGGNSGTNPGGSTTPTGKEITGKEGLKDFLTSNDSECYLTSNISLGTDNLVFNTSIDKTLNLNGYSITSSKQTNSSGTENTVGVICILGGNVTICDKSAEKQGEICRTGGVDTNKFHSADIIVYCSSSSAKPTNVVLSDVTLTSKVDTLPYGVIIKSSGSGYVPTVKINDVKIIEKNSGKEIDTGLSTSQYSVMTELNAKIEVTGYAVNNYGKINKISGGNYKGLKSYYKGNTSSVDEVSPSATFTPSASF